MEDVVSVKSARSMTFLEGFLRCHFQIEVGMVSKKVSALCVNEPWDEALFK